MFLLHDVLFKVNWMAIIVASQRCDRKAVDCVAQTLFQPIRELFSTPVMFSMYVSLYALTSS